MATMQKLTTNLWFDKQAEDAAKHYTSIFHNSKMGRITRYGKEGYEIHQMPEGTVMTVDFEIEGQQFVALNGGPLFKFNESISFVVNCDTQEEIDYYWSHLTQGGNEKDQQCGWLKDKFGLSWQVVPKVLSEFLQDRDPQKAGRTMKAMLQMKKMDIATLQRAFDGEGAA